MVDLAGSLAGGAAGVSNFFGHFAALPAAGNAGRLAIIDDAPVSQWVDDGTRWRPMINGLIGLRPPAVAAMTAFNQGAATFTDLNGAVNVVGVNDGAAPGQLRGMTVANVATTAYARGTFQLPSGGDVTANHFAAATLVLREAATAKAYTLQAYQDFNGRQTLFQVALWTSNTVRPTTVDKGYAIWDASAPLALRVRRNGANLFGEYSRDGVNWLQVDTRATGTVFTTAPDQAGWAINSINCVGQMNVLSFESGG